MKTWRRAAALVAPVLITGFFAPVALAASAGSSDSGDLLGWVRDGRGAPVAGAVISLFGKGVGTSGLVTFSDSTGRFSLPSLPAGSYTLRALRAGQGSSSARRVTVVPNSESQFTVSLSAEAEAAAAAVAAAAEEAGNTQNGVDTATNRRELTWLLRHKRRSVLEDGSPAPQTQGVEAPRTASLGSWLPQMGGTLELVAHPESVGLGDAVLDGDSPAASLSALRLQGRFSDSGSWSLGGLVSESGSTSWRMAAEFVLDAGDHQIRAGSGYGTRMLRQPVEIQSTRDERVGAIFVQDRWQATDALSTTMAARFSHIGFLDRATYLDPAVVLEAKTAPGATLRATAWRRTLAPGGDLLMLSTLATAPSIALAALEDGLRAERAQHIEVSMEEKLGASTTLRAHTFFEDVHDHLGNTFDRGGRASSLRIFNAGRMTARGLGLTFERRFGSAVNGSLTYTYGHGSRPQEALDAGQRHTYRVLSFDDADFHDVVARIETIVAGSDTRLVAFYRVNGLVPEDDRGAVVSSRFDLQLSQGLPFLGSLTHADWDLLLSVRNLYYEADEGAMLDEVAVANPPTRVLGGIAVRF